MFSIFKRLVGNITVSERDGTIFVEGVDVYALTNNIFLVWRNNRLKKFIFSDADRSSFSIPSFFAPDLYFTLNKVANHPDVSKGKRSLTRVRDLLLENTWLKRTTEEIEPILDHSVLKEFFFTPFDHQMAFLEAYDRSVQQYGLRGMLVAAAAGTGKTMISMFLSRMLDSDIIIIVSPKNAIYTVWKQTLLTSMKKTPSFWICDEGQRYEDQKYLVFSYEQLDQAVEIAKRFRNDKVLVVLDESHNFNTRDSLRTDRFLTVCETSGASDVIWLSGTPVKAYAIEAIPLFKCIDPMFTADVEQRFRGIYGGTNTNAVEILKNRMDIVSFKVEKKELKLLPPIWHELKIKSPNAQMYTLTKVKEAMKKFIEERAIYYKEHTEEHHKAFEDCLAYYEGQLTTKADVDGFKEYKANLRIVIKSNGDWNSKDQMLFCNKYENSKILPKLTSEMRPIFKDVKSVVKYVHLKIQGECLGRIVGGMRVAAHVDMVESVDFHALCDSTTKKTVVFTSFVEVIKKCEILVPQQGLEPLFVYGKTNANLPAIIKEFGQNENKNPLFATFASLSTAVPLIMADNMLLFDSPFRGYILDQTVSRIHRIGADTQTHVTRLILDTGEEPNISSRSTDILKWSQQSVEEILGIKSPFDLNESTDDLTIAVEGLELGVDSVKDLTPSFLSW